MEEHVSNSEQPSISERAKELEQLIRVSGQQYARLEQRLEESAHLEVEDRQIATDIYQVAISKLEPTQDDVVFIWLPDRATDRDIAAVSKILGEIIQRRFRFVVARKDALEIEVVKGKHSTILLPS